MIAVILLISVLVLAIAFLCVRFTLHADIHRAGTTVVLVTHDVRVATRAERVVFIFDGKIAGEHVTWLAEMRF